MIEIRGIYICWHLERNHPQVRAKVMAEGKAKVSAIRGENAKVEVAACCEHDIRSSII